MLYYCRVSSLRSGPDLDRVVGEARRQGLLAGGRAVADLQSRKFKYRRKKRTIFYLRELTAVGVGHSSHQPKASIRMVNPMNVKINYTF